MRRFAVTVYVEAEDTVGAIEAAADLFANPDALHLMAATGEVVVRPARKVEGL
jgi:hypothetical protein